MSRKEGVCVCVSVIRQGTGIEMQRITREFGKQLLSLSFCPPLPLCKFTGKT